MPIDPDAYMSGAIPTLSRGGSWLPPSHAGASTHRSEATSQYPKNVYSRYTPPSPTLAGSLPLSPLHPAMSFLPGLASSSVWQSYEEALRSPLYRGWGHGLGTMTVTTPSIAPFGGEMSYGSLTSDIPPPESSSHNLRSERGRSKTQRAPALKTTLTEADHRGNACTPARMKQPIPPMTHRRRAESLPSPPAQSATSPKSSSRLAPASASGSRLDTKGSRAADSTIGRSTSHTHLSTLDEGARARSDVEPDHPKRSPPHRRKGDTPMTPLAKPLCRSSDADLPTLPLPKTPYVKRGRPPALRRHTSHAASPGTLRTTIKRERFISSPERQRPLSVPDTSRTRELHPSLPTPERPAFNMTSLRSALPRTNKDLLPHPMWRKRPRSEAPSGYIAPLSCDGYDRYSAHPADTGEIIPDPKSPTIAPTGTAATTSTGYIPVGFASPTKDLAWNRDGPAMKTHGVAWKRHTDHLVLPTGPAGPRWTQARPPRVDVVTGGGWWESGGQ